jgi:hypothetical protein
MVWDDSSVSEWRMIGHVDVKSAGQVHHYLRAKGVASLIEGSAVYTIRVSPLDAAKARLLLQWHPLAIHVPRQRYERV